MEFGESINVVASVRPALFEPTAQITSITADLSGLGGPVDVPLEDVDLAVYNLAGQKVVTLAQSVREAGSYTIHWDGKDDQGHNLASGVYLYRLQARAQVQSRKLVLIQ